MKFFDKIRGAIKEPTKFFHEIKKEKGIGHALIFYIIFLVINTLLSILYFTKVFSAVPELGAFAGAITAGLIVMQFIFSLVMLFIITGLVHLFSGWMKGKGKYEDTFKAMIYGMTPNLIFSPILMLYMGIVGIQNIMALIPMYLVSAGIGIWSIVLEIIGLKIAHKYSTWRAVLSLIIIPIVLVIIIAIILVIIILAMMGIII